MNRMLLLAITCLVTLAASARAHFPFIVPDPGGAAARLYMSELLEADPEVRIELLARSTLSIRDSHGKETPLELTRAGHAMTLALPGDGTRIVHGVSDLGVMQRGDGPAHRLIYYPKTIIGDAFAPATVLGDAVPVEIVPQRAREGVKLRLMIDGKPAAGAEIRVILPGGLQDNYTTDADGLTEAFPDRGRYGAWARSWQEAAGEQAGKRYAQVRRYATVVFDFSSTAGPAGAAGAAGAADASDAVDAGDAVDASAAGAVGAAVDAGAAGAAVDAVNASAASDAVDAGDARAAGDATAGAFFKPAPAAAAYPALPQAVASFGAVACDGWLYVYGGHTAERHHYSTASVSGRFSRLNLRDPKRWETLPGGVAVQGMNLAAHRGKVYRVGGMEPRNAPGEEADNHSIDLVQRFDPASGEWETLAPLPAPRSSHDLMFVGDTLYVTGGWHMKGKGEEPAWHETVDVLDVSSAELKWRSIPQPFACRALIAAALGDRLYVIGGMDGDNEIRPDVDVLDIATGRWSKGPPIPGGGREGFSPAACTIGGRLYLSVGSGAVFRLSPDGRSWEPFARSTPRIVHRMVPHEEKLLLLGGASRAKMLDLVEAIPLAGSGARSAAGH